MEALDAFWSGSRNQLPWNCLFVTPYWLQSVVGQLGARGEPLILSLEHNGRVVGIAPFARKDRTLYFLGIADVCDYQDIIAAPGLEKEVVQKLIAHIAELGIERLELESLRSDAVLSKAIKDIENDNRVKITRSSVDVTYEAELPDDWEGYLKQLKGKQRHEVRRKIRRLEKHGACGFRTVRSSNGHDDATDEFLRLFHLNRTDKSAFMDQTMSDYFRMLIKQLARQEMLQLCFLDVDGQPVATVLCFDYQGTRYLYNSGYDAQYQNLSVGILCKIFSIKHGIETGCRRFDFLRGAEVYKKRIGGKEIPLYRYVIEL